MTIKFDETPPQHLEGFDSYDDFLEFAKALFSLENQEYRALYEVLLKLQAIGEDPTETMKLWKKDTCRKECPEFIRFMIQVDTMDIKDPENVI